MLILTRTEAEEASQYVDFDVRSSYLNGKIGRYEEKNRT